MNRDEDNDHKPQSSGIISNARDEAVEGSVGKETAESYKQSAKIYAANREHYENMRNFCINTLRQRLPEKLDTEIKNFKEKTDDFLNNTRVYHDTADLVGGGAKGTKKLNLVFERTNKSMLQVVTSIRDTLSSLKKDKVDIIAPSDLIAVKERLDEHSKFVEDCSELSLRNITKAIEEKELFGNNRGVSH